MLLPVPLNVISRENVALRAWTQRLIPQSQDLIVATEVLRAQSRALHDGSDLLVEDLRLAAWNRRLLKALN